MIVLRSHRHMSIRLSNSTKVCINVTQSDIHLSSQLECGWFRGKSNAISMDSLSCRAKATTTTTTTTTTKTTTTTRATTTTTTTQPSVVRDPMSNNMETGTDRLQVNGACGITENFGSRLVGSESNKIVNGSVAQRGAWPWIVRMSFRFQNGSGLCGGSIIDNEWILTAAHCCDGARSVTMTVSDFDRFMPDQGEFRVSSSQMFMHPFYQRGNGLDWDICLVKTQQRLT